MRRTYAIGDVHGRADLLADLLAAIRVDAATADRPLLVFLGDYVDRGPDSRGVIDLVLAGLPGFDVVRLKGNHEDMMAAFLFGGDRRLADAWLYNGADATLQSYGLRYGRPPAEVLAAIPADHQEFLQSGMVLSWREGRYLFVHAGIRPGVPLDDQRPMDLMWIRSEFLNNSDYHGAIIVHGHTITERPALRPNRIGIDTGAFATGRLTCVVLSDGAPRFLVAAQSEGVAA